MGIGLEEVAEVVHRIDISRLFYQNLLSPLEMGTECEVSLRQVICYRAEDSIEGWIWSSGGRMRSCS